MRNALSLAFASALDPGRLRHNNEDALCVDAAAGVAVLADGMGGYNAGEVAASMATSNSPAWAAPRARPKAC